MQKQKAVYGLSLGTLCALEYITYCINGMIKVWTYKVQMYKYQTTINNSKAKDKNKIIPV